MRKQLKNVCFAAGIALMTTCLTFPSQLMAQESARKPAPNAGFFLATGSGEDIRRWLKTPIFCCFPTRYSKSLLYL